MTAIERVRRAALLVTLTTGGYAAVVRPWLLRWGATSDEAARSLPGDAFVARPKYQQTHAITIQAPPEGVWPWLAQLGQGRGGLYSYDRLENLFGLDIHSADRIVPELQHLRVGDEIRLVPKDVPAPLNLKVAALVPGRWLVLTGSGDIDAAKGAGLPWPSWAFVLEPAGPGATRLLVRFRSDFRPTLAGWLVNKYALEPVHFVMERKMLLGIKRRAEAAVPRPASATWRSPGRLEDDRRRCEHALDEGATAARDAG